MPALTKAMLRAENAALRQQVAELERQLAARQPVSEKIEPTHAEIEQDKSLFEAVMENIPVGVAITGGPPDFALKWVSRFGLEMTQRPTDSLIGLASGFHQANWGLLLADGVTRPSPEQMPLYRASRLGEKVQNEEFVLVTADQRHLTALVDAAPIRDAEGKIAGAINSWRDITERKRMEESLRQARDVLEAHVQQRTSELMQANAALQINQATLQGFYDSVLLMMGVAELEGDKVSAVSANHATKSFLEMSLEDLQRQAEMELNSPQGFERVWIENYQRCLREGAPVRFQYEHPHSSGNRWLEVNATFIGNSASGKPRFSFVAEDITERKRAEQALRESEVLLNQVLESTLDVVFAVDWDYCLLVNNQRHQQALVASGGHRFEVGEFVLSPDYPLELRAYWKSGYDRALGGEECKLESEASIEGQQHVYENNFSPLRDASGAIIGALIVAHDITERKRTEEALRQLNERLEQRVAERTAELLESNENLKKENVERRRVEQEREDLLQKIQQAHDQLQGLSRQLIETQERERRAIGRELHDEIGQTLTGLKILLDVAQRLLNGEYRQKLAQAQQAAGELIDRVSALSLDLRPPMLDDLGLLPALLWFVDRYASQTNIQVEFHHAGILNRRFAPAIETAVYRLAQEALTNAARYAGVNNVVVRINAGEAEMELSIEDAGKGFEVQSALSGKNTVGLSGMRERVRLLSGDLEIDSEPGQGTRIFIRLPLDQE